MRVTARADAGERVAALDIFRGLIMALMALDHTRAFFFGFEPSPTDLAATTPALFATRWITHLCAPGFLFLAGVSASLKARSTTRGRLATYLLTRGAFLVALEYLVVTSAWIPDPTRSMILLQVIWAIGWSMILLGLLVRLPAPLVGLLGLAVMALHPLAAPYLAAAAPAWLHAILLAGDGAQVDTGGQTLIVVYPILPWAGVMAAGYGAGALFAGPPRRWGPAALGAGLALVALFAALRWAEVGGDPVGWRAAGGGALAFLNVEKYPPSPLFLTATLGVSAVLLGLIALRPVAAGFLAPLGRAPLFFYVLHLYALRLAGLAAAAAVWGPDRLGPPPLHSTPEWPLWAIWAIWPAAMLLLFPPIRWFARLKARRRGGWTGYL